MKMVHQPPTSRFRAYGATRLRRALDLRSGRATHPNDKARAMASAFREARYFYACAARVVLVERARVAL